MRSGNCSENCSFCSQSGHHKGTTAPVYGFIDSEDLTEQAKRAREWGASDFGVVSKGWGMRSEKEREKLGEYFKDMAELSDIGRCTSLGVLTEKTAIIMPRARPLAPSSVANTGSTGIIMPTPRRAMNTDNTTVIRICLLMSCLDYYVGGDE